MAILQQETPRKIILHLIENPGSTQREISQHISFSSPTVKWHMSKMMDMDLVYSKKEGKSIKYHLKGDVNDIITLMKRYHPSMWSKLSDRLAEIFIELVSVSKSYETPIQDKQPKNEEGYSNKNNLDDKDDAYEQSI